MIYLRYDGSNYHGWQVQPHSNSVQGELQRALSTLLRQEMPVVGAGRTDTGVHARMMTAHFDYDGALDTAQLAYKLNRLLPPDISIDRVEAVDGDLHARFSATSRTYHYYIHRRKDPFCRHYSWELRYELDFDAMNEAASHLLKVADFAAFCKSGSDVKTTLCEVTEAYWTRCGVRGTRYEVRGAGYEVRGAGYEDEAYAGGDADSWCFVITANRFLRNMVRAVVGTLIEVGRHRITVAEFDRIVAGGKRTEAGDSVPAHALFLWEVGY